MSRRLLAACALAAAVGLALRLAFPPPPPVGTSVVVATRALPAGHVLAAADVRTARWAGPDAPRSPVTAAGLLGRPLVVPVAAGDTVTPRQVLGPSLLAGRGPGSSAVPLSGLDPLVVSAVRVGDHVRVWCGPDLVSDGAVVLTVSQLRGGGLAGGTEGPRSLLVGLTSAEIGRLHRARASVPDPPPVEVALVTR